MYNRSSLVLALFSLAFCVLVLTGRSTRAVAIPNASTTQKHFALLTAPTNAHAVDDDQEGAREHRVLQRAPNTLAARQAQDPSPTSTSLTRSSVTSSSSTTTVGSSSANSSSSSLPMQVSLVIPDVGADGKVASVRYVVSVRKSEQCRS